MTRTDLYLPICSARVWTTGMAGQFPTSSSWCVPVTPKWNLCYPWITRSY